MSSVDRLRQVIEDVDDVEGYYDLTPEQLAQWMVLRKAELEAQVKTHEFLNGLLPEPLSDEERARMRALHIEEFALANTGDGMSEESVEAELDAMSDYEFVQNFSGEVEGGCDGEDEHYVVPGRVQ